MKNCNTLTGYRKICSLFFLKLSPRSSFKPFLSVWSPTVFNQHLSASDVPSIADSIWKEVNDEHLCQTALRGFFLTDR